MEKRLTIEGMSCAKCVQTVERALNAIEGVEAKVDLQGADVSLSKSIAEPALVRAVREAGFTVSQVENTIDKA